MGGNIDKEQMSETYRRIKRRRARERKKRQRRLFMMKMICAVAFVIGIIILVICMVAGRRNRAGEDEATSAQETVQAGIVYQQLQAAEPAAEVPTEPFTEPQTEPAAVMAYPKVTADYVSIPQGELLSPYQVLYSVNENRLLAGRHSMEIIYPASMTKVMSLIVAVEHLDDMDRTFEMTSEIIDPLVEQQASRAGFDPGEVINVRDLLYGMTLPSGADAATALAILSAGTEEEFVRLMNEKCEELGLKHTHFTNPTGLHNSRQYSTPAEIAMIMAYAMENETCARILGTYQYTTQATPQHPEGLLLTSTMYSRMYGDEVEGINIVAGKTGYTDEAGNCLVSCAKNGDETYIAVSAGAENRWHVIYDAFDIYKKYALGITKSTGEKSGE